VGCGKMLTLCQRVFSRLREEEELVVVVEEDDPSKSSQSRAGEVSI